jgi:hypothetical protein
MSRSNDLFMALWLTLILKNYVKNLGESSTLANSWLKRGILTTESAHILIPALSIAVIMTKDRSGLKLMHRLNVNLLLIN